MQRPGLLKIAELARRAGVNRGTIQHYLREGLLPRPVKTHRNMAFYDEACVDRIKVIRDLQKERFLPLSVIRRLVASPNGGAQAKAAAEVQQAALSSISVDAPAVPVSMEAAARTFDLSRTVIGKLEELGLVSSHELDGAKVFRGPDLEVLAAVAQLKRLGVAEHAGFRPEDLLIYSKAIRGLLELEVATFLRVVMSKNQPGEATRLARASVNGATALIVALRKKFITDLLVTAGGENTDRALPNRTDSAAATSPSPRSSRPLRKTPR